MDLTLAHEAIPTGVGIGAAALFALDLLVHAGNVIVLVQWFKDRVKGKNSPLPSCSCGKTQHKC